MSSLVHRGRTAATWAALQSRRDAPAASGAVVTRADPVRRPTSAVDVMTRFPLTVHENASMWTAWDTLHGTGQSHLVVVDHDQRPVGVLDERTIALEWPTGPLAAHRTPVRSLLRGRTRPRVRSGDDLETVAQVMVDARADAVPVVDRGGRLFGLITLWHYAQLALDGTSVQPTTP